MDSGAAFTGGAGNDTFNAILGTGATLNSFDAINGGTGTDTLNIASDVAGAQTMPAAVTIAGMEIVNLSRSGVGANALTVTNTTFGTGVQNFSVVDAGNNNAVGSAQSVTLASATSVSVVSAATAFTSITVIDTDDTSTATQGSTLTTVTAKKSAGAVAIKGNGVTTVNLDTIGGLTTITSATGARSLTVNATGTGAIAGLTDSKATTVTLNQAGNQAFGTLTVAKAATINVNATAAAITDATTATIVGAVATALNVGGTHAQTLSIAAADNPVLATITVTGSGGVALGDLSTLATLTSVDTSAATNVASAATASNKTVANSVTLGTTTAFVGGDGADAVTVGATTKSISLGGGANVVNLSVTALGTGGSITGGGTDTLGLSDANAQTLSTVGAAQTAFAAAVTDFSKLALGAQTASTTITSGGFEAFNTVSFTEGANAFVTTLKNLPSGSTVNITNAGVTSTGGLTTSGSLGANATDSLTVGFISTAASQASNYGTVTTPNLGNLNLVSSGSAAANIGGVNTVAIADAALKILTVSGTNGFVLGTLTGATSLTTINASGLTGAAGISVTTAADQFATTITGSSGTGGDTINAANALAAVTISTTATGTNSLTGASGAFVNTITAGNGTNTIVGGSAADVITVGTGANVVTGGAGADKINFAIHTGATIDKIIQTAVGNSGTFTAPATNTISTTTFDVVTGLKAGDQISLAAYTGAGVTAGTTLMLDTANAGSANTLVGLGTVAQHDYFVRGTYDPVGKTFVGSATGADTLFVYDGDATLATTAQEAIVLVGYVAATVTGVNAALGLVTLG